MARIGRKLLRCLTLAGCLLALSTAASAGIMKTRHNLTGSGLKHKGDDSTAICAFCHTPHGDVAAQPQWESLEPGKAAHFVTFDSFGRSSVEGSRTVGSVSMLCLSCHDGSQALNVVSTPSHSTRIDSSQPGGGGTRPAVVAAVRIDLDETHPVGVPYGGMTHPDYQAQGLRGKVTSADYSPWRRRPLSNYRPANSAVIDDVQVWWVETGNIGRQRSDLQLFTRIVDGEDSVPFVECASCHDPHSEAEKFLRQKSESSGICMACHDI